MRTLNQPPHQHFSANKNGHLKMEPAHWIAGRALCFHLGGRSKMMEMVRPNLGTHMTHMPH